MNTKVTAIAAALAAAYLVPGIASADFILDTGVPTGSAAPTVLNTSQFLAGEFAATQGDTITELSAYLTQGVGQPGDTFTFDIYSASNFLGTRASSRILDYTIAGTFGANGWNSTAANWTPSATGDYWLALQVNSTTNTKGLDAPSETSAVTGTAPALAFAFAGTNGEYSSSGAPAIGLQVTEASPVPLPAAIWLLGSGVMGLGSMARRRRSGVQAGR